MLKTAVMGLALAAMAGAAFAAPAQSEMLTQTVASVTNPMSAWQASFSPNMVSRLRPLEVRSLSPNCRPVVVGLDKKPVSTAGAMLLAGALCIAAPQAGLKSGLTSQGVANGIDATSLKSDVAGPPEAPVS